MSRSTDKALLRAKPEMAYVVTEAKGEGTAAMVVKDACDEEFAGKQMMLHLFEVGKNYWMETAIWVYIGKCVHVGFDFIVLDEAARIPVDGLHHTMMEQGCAAASGLELEKTGQPPFNRMRIPCDWIGPNCEWIHPIPKESIRS